MTVCVLYEVSNSHMTAFNHTACQLPIFAYKWSSLCAKKKIHKFTTGLYTHKCALVNYKRADSAVNYTFRVKSI